LRGSYGDFKAKGADVVAIGMGRPDMAADFRDKQAIPFRLLVDHDKETYRLLEMKRGGLMDVVGPAVWWRGAKGILSGHGVATPKQDPYQMGGVAVVAAGGEISYIHRSEEASDNIPVEDLLKNV
jgi:peroxiredoxin